MFASLTSPELVVANLIATGLLAILFFAFHPRKYDTMLVFIVGNMIGLIVRFFIGMEIGIETAFGLFAIFSLMHFRESYNTYTMTYLFLSLSMGILSSFMHGDHDLILFAILSIVVLLFVFLFEKFVVSVKKVSYTVPIYELQNGFTERVRRDLGGVKVKDVSIQSVDGEQAKVVVTYRRK